MFIGLVATTGTLLRIERTGTAGARLAFTAPFDDGEPLVLGESIAVNGACLTVDKILSGDPAGFEIDASAETLARTTLGALVPGARVHLERALRAADRLGGHLVTGHVDGVGSLVARRPVGDAVCMTFRVPAELAKFVAEKGSVTVEGVSLTVNAVRGADFDVTIIPHTLEKTTLGGLVADESGRSRVNLEVDLIARYVARLLESSAGPSPTAGPSDKG
jgi:riboflavin synthase